MNRLRNFGTYAKRSRIEQLAGLIQRLLFLAGISKRVENDYHGSIDSLAKALQERVLFN